MNPHDPSPAAGAAEILLVEDNPGDVLLIEEALRDSESPSRLHVVDDGVEALEFLRRRGRHADAPRPDLVLLDLNLPKVGGCEVLAAIKSDPRLRRIPVVVLTTSAAEEDIDRSHDLHANGYVTKPIDYDRFARVIRSVQEFWISIAESSRERRNSRPGGAADAPHTFGERMPPVNVTGDDRSVSLSSRGLVPIGTEGNPESRRTGASGLNRSLDRVDDRRD